MPNGRDAYPATPAFGAWLSQMPVVKVVAILGACATVVAGIVACVGVILYVDDLIETIEANSAADDNLRRAIMRHHPEFQPEGVFGALEKEETP